MPNSKLNNFTIFCDDVRTESNNKLSLIGCLQDVLYFKGEYPINIRVNAVCHLFLETGSFKGKSLYLSAPGMKKRKIDLTEMPSSGPGTYVRAILDLSRVVFETDGFILIEYGSDKGKKELVGKLQLIKSDELPPHNPVISKEQKLVAKKRKKK